MRQLSLLLPFILLFTSNICAQVEKGGYFVDLTATKRWDLNYHVYKENYIGLSAVTFQKMVTDRWMLGTGFRHIDDNLGIFYFVTFAGGEPRNSFPYYLLEIPLNARYYFSTNKLAFYAQLQQNFGYFDINNETRLSPTANVNLDDGFNYEAFVGLGVDYFLSSNVVLNAEFATTTIAKGDYYDNSERLYFNLGLKLYFNKKWEESIDDLASMVLKKGNIGLSGNATFTHFYGEKERDLIRIAPRASYHLTDRWLVGIDLFYTNRNEDLPSLQKEITGTWGAYTAYYLPLGKKLYLSPLIGANFGRTGRNNLKEEFWKERTVYGGLYLNYFHQNIRASIGPNFTHEKRIYRRNQGVRKWLTASVETKVDYFVYQNIYFTSILDYNVSKFVFDNDESVDFFDTGAQFLRLNFGIGFIL